MIVILIMVVIVDGKYTQSTYVTTKIFIIIITFLNILVIVINNLEIL
jgi:hypothetical protein